MKPSKTFEILLAKILCEKDRDIAELELLAVLAGEIKSEILLLDATIDYMLAHRKENDFVEKYVVDCLIDKLTDKKEMLRVVKNFMSEE